MRVGESPAREESVLARSIPALAWIGNYQREWLRFDLIAGLTTAALVIPQSIACATLAGLPVQAGLYTVLADAGARASIRRPVRGGRRVSRGYTRASITLGG